MPAARPRQSSRQSSPQAFGQEGQDLRGGNVTGDEGLSYAVREDEGERAARHLLVLGDKGEEPLGPRQFARHVGQSGRQPNRAEMRLYATRIVGTGEVEP